MSPRLNAVWKAAPDTTIHAGYSRYFTPPPFELVASETIAKFANTTAAPEITLSDPPMAERSDYYDLGIEQKAGQRLTLGIDSYYRKSSNLIDEGQFGAPIILTPFNYRDGIIEGIEFTANYIGSHWTHGLREPGLPERAWAWHRDGAVQLRPGRSGLHRDPLHPSGPRAADHGLGRRLLCAGVTLVSLQICCWVRDCAPT